MWILRNINFTIFKLYQILQLFLDSFELKKKKTKKNSVTVQASYDEYYRNDDHFEACELTLRNKGKTKRSKS